MAVAARRDQRQAALERGKTGCDFDDIARDLLANSANSCAIIALVAMAAAAYQSAAN